MERAPDRASSARASARAAGPGRRLSSRLRLRTILGVGASALALTACGSTGGTAASRPGPPTPVNLSVYVDNARISVSPRFVGAGPVIFVVTNQASHAEVLAISRRSANARPLASTAPINPQGTTQVSVDFTPGDYTIATAPHGETDAQRSRVSSISSATLHIGRPRPSSSSAVLAP